MGGGRRFAIVRRRAVAIVVAGAAIAVAVGLVESARDDGPPPVGGTAAEAVAVVDDFQRALSTRDYAAVCDRLFTSRAREAAGGEDCQSVLAQAASRLTAPTVEITSVVLSRDGKATVGVLARTAGRRPAPDVIRLERERGRFRIASAGDAARRG